MRASTASLPSQLFRLYKISLVALTAPVILAEYFRSDTGSEYDIGFTTKFLVAAKMLRNNRSIPTGSTFLEHLVMATKILNTPRSVDGAIVECGCYKGGSTANLSLVASLCDRDLVVFDSFDGMPKPSDRDREHTLINSGEVHTYDEGAWRASLAEVKANVTTYGDGSVCTFYPGYFEKTMPVFDDPVVAVFVDVGLRDSAETCLEHLWPLLADGCYLFTHEAKHMELASLFFDADWWRTTLDEEPPGLVGAGSGLGLHPGSNGFSSLLGYTVKNPNSLGLPSVEETGEGYNCVNATFARDD